MLSPIILQKCMLSGPASVETVLEKLTGAIDPKGLQRYQSFVDQLERQKASPAVSFLSAYFHQQAAGYCQRQTEKEGHLREALVQYRAFLDSRKNRNPDTRFFAQWQTGVVLNSLKEPWPIAEEAFLKAFEYDMTRGESVKAVLGHHLGRKEWRKAHIYSSYCVREFLDKPPIDRFWHIDEGFYSWKILKYHIYVLGAIRKTDEAQLYIKMLSDRLITSHPHISEKDREAIAEFIHQYEGSMT